MRSLHHNSIKIHKQISLPTQKYEKISDIYFLCSVSLSDFIAIQPSILVFCSFKKNVIHFFIVVAHISLFISLYIAFCLFVYHDMCCAIWSYGHKIE